MSEKRYLLTESDIRQIKDLECGWCADNAGGHFNCADASNAEQERFLEAHEYRERTCSWVYDDATDSWDTECGGKILWDHGAPKYCPECGGKAVDR